MTTPPSSAPRPSSGPSGDAELLARLLAEARGIKGVSLWQDARRRLRRSWPARLSMLYLALLGVVALITPLLPLQSPIRQDLRNRQFLPPNLTPISLEVVEPVKRHAERQTQLAAELARASGDERAALQTQFDRHRQSHPAFTYWNNPNAVSRLLIRCRVALFGDWCIPSICGTDNLGRDVLSRICWGARVSIMVGLVATFVSLLIGVSYGAIAGYCGGVIDAVMMRVVDVLYSIPFLFVVIFAMTILNEPSNKAWLATYGIDQIAVLYILIGLIYWLTMSRVVRGQVISLKNEQFIDAAQTVGASSTRIIFRHLVPNTMGIVIVYLTLTIPAVMLFEAFLSFLGLGVSPPDVSWGILMSEGLQVITGVRIYWWLVLFPGMAMTLTLFALNFLGDGLRDALDPRLKNKT